MEEYLIRTIGQLAGGGDVGNGGNDNPKPAQNAAAKSSKSQHETTAEPPKSYLDAFALGQLSCVSKAVSKRCAEDDIVGGVMRSQWPGTSKLDPSLLMMTTLSTAPHASAGTGVGNDDDPSGDDKKEAASGYLWLFRQMASRLVLRNSGDGDDEDEDEKEDEGGKDAVTPSSNKRRKVESGKHCLGLFNVYDDVTRRAIISHVLTGEDDLGEFMDTTGTLVFDLPVPVVLPRTKLRLSTEPYEYGNFELVPGQGKPSYSMAFDLFGLDTCSRLGGFILDTSRPENIESNVVNIVEGICDDSLLCCGERRIIDKTVDWKNEPSLGRYVVFSGNGPRLQKRMHRRVMNALGGRQYEVGVRAELKTQCPSRSARHIGMNFVMDECRHHFEDAEEIFFAATESVDSYWWEGEDDPDLFFFFDMAQKELNDADEPSASVVKVKLRVDISVDNYFKRFEDTGITPRELLETLKEM